MNKKLVFVIVFLNLFILAGCANNKSSINNNQIDKVVLQKQTQQELPMSSKAMIADRVQVFLFHATQRCSTCIAIGRLAGETVNERFQDELKSGKIEFREVNIDLPENKKLAQKFQASGSALYLNAVRGLQDDIEQDARVWRLTGDPEAFKSYLEGRINILLGK